MRKRSLRSIGLESRIEDLVETNTVVVADPAIAEPVAAPVETVIIMDNSATELQAVADAQAEVNDNVDAIDELAVVADRLAEVRGNIEATLPNGGLTQGEAVAYQCATNAIVADVGVSEVLPAMENFGGSMSRKEATTASMEALDGVIGKIVKRTGELLSGLGDKIVALIKKIIAYFTSDKSRLQKLKTALATASRDKVTINVHGEYAEFVSGTTLKSFLNAAEKTLENVLSSVTVVERLRMVANREPMSRHTLIPGSTHTTKGEADVHTATFGSISFVEVLPMSYDASSEYEAHVDFATRDSKDVTVSKADVLNIIDTLLKTIESKQIAKFDSPAKIKSISAIIDTILAVGGKVESTETGKEAVAHARAIGNTSTAFALDILSTYSSIFQGMVTVASKATAEMTKATPAALPNKG